MFILNMACSYGMDHLTSRMRMNGSLFESVFTLRLDDGDGFMCNVLFPSYIALTDHAIACSLENLLSS